MGAAKPLVQGAKPMRQFLCFPHRVSHLGCGKQVAQHLAKCCHPSRRQNHPSAPACNGCCRAEVNWRISLPHGVRSQDAKRRSPDNEINGSSYRNSADNSKRNCLFWVLDFVRHNCCALKSIPGPEENRCAIEYATEARTHHWSEMFYLYARQGKPDIQTQQYDIDEEYADEHF